MDWDNEPVVWSNEILYRITPEGTILSVWNLQIYAPDVNNLAIGPTVHCLAIVACDDKFYFSSTGTCTGHCNILEVRPRSPDAEFKAIAFKKDNSHISSIISVVNKGDSRAEDVYSIEKNQCELHLRDWNFVVKNRAMKSIQKIEMKSAIAKSYKPCHHWYDKERGLVFSTNGISLTVQRITYN